MTYSLPAHKIKYILNELTPSFILLEYKLLLSTTTLEFSCSVRDYSIRATQVTRPTFKKRIEKKNSVRKSPGLDR